MPSPLDPSHAQPQKGGDAPGANPRSHTPGDASRALGASGPHSAPPCGVQSPAARSQLHPPMRDGGPKTRLRLDDEQAFDLLALRTLGIATNAELVHRLDCTEDELLRFLRRKPVQDKVAGRTLELRVNGEIARMAANAALVDGVAAMHEIVRDEDMRPSSRIGATSTLSKIASHNGRQVTTEVDSGVRFHLTLNLGHGNSQEIAVTGEEVIDDDQ